MISAHLKPIGVARREIANEERAAMTRVLEAKHAMALEADKDEAQRAACPDVGPVHNPEDVAFRPDPARIADMSCDRCDADMTEDRASLLIHGAEELLIAIASDRLAGDPVWDLAHAQYQALMESL
ncbi:MAG: hypothetical protein EOM91_22880 [Sphingobacteriia bacterium]|nr:hypothetical protein [Sphingobacteriia bacterium]